MSAEKDVIRGWESISEETTKQTLAATSKTDMTQLYFVIREWKTPKRENNVCVKTQYQHRTNGYKLVIYQPRLATSIRTSSSVGFLPSILQKKEPEFMTREIQSCIPKLYNTDTVLIYNISKTFASSSSEIMQCRSISQKTPLFDFKMGETDKGNI